MSDHPQPSLPQNVWDDYARGFIALGFSPEAARDQVILRCLTEGDTDAFVSFETQGHTPGREVLRLLSLMMSDTSRHRNSEAAAKIAGWAPFRLVCKRRDGKAGRRDDVAVTMRDELIALRVRSLVVERGLSVEGAVAATAEEISEPAAMRNGRSRKEETVRKAYQRHFGKGKGK